MSPKAVSEEEDIYMRRRIHTGYIPQHAPRMSLLNTCSGVGFVSVCILLLMYISSSSLTNSQLNTCSGVGFFDFGANLVGKNHVRAAHKRLVMSVAQSVYLCMSVVTSL